MINRTDKVVFYDGSRTDLIYKAEFKYSEFKYEVDLTKRSKTSFNIPKNGVQLRELDLFWLTYRNVELCGRIEKVEAYTNYSTVTVYVGYDSFDFDVDMPENKIVDPNISESYSTALTVTTDVSGTVSTSDGDLAYDTLIRQAMRQTPREHTMGLTPSEDALHVSITDYPEEIYKLSITDNNLSNVDYKFTTDGFNYLRLKKDGKYKDYYYTLDGKVTENIAEAQFPLLQKVEKLEEGSATIDDVAYVLSKFKSQEYDHIVEFDYDLIRGNLEAMEFDTKLLGRKIIVYIDEYDLTLTSIVSAISIEGEIMSIKLGLSRTRMSEKLNSDTY